MTETWRSVSRLERADFYSDWLAASERNAAIVEHSPIVARGRELTWIETPNEDRIAMLIGEQVGFPTNGTSLCRVAVPEGRHTGRHRHGEDRRAPGAGCLDQCEHGVTVVVYPKQVWYGNVTVADVPELIERHIVGGEYVERLMIPEQPHLGGAASSPPLPGREKPRP